MSPLPTYVGEGYDVGPPLRPALASSWSDNIECTYAVVQLSCVDACTNTVHCEAAGIMLAICGQRSHIH